MEALDKRGVLFELEEIYKYKDLIEKSDKSVIQEIIYNGDKEAMALYNEFIILVGKEVDHQLNKAEFTVLKDELVGAMKEYLK